METISLFSLLFFESNSSCLYRCNIKCPVKEFPGVGFCISLPSEDISSADQL